MKNLSVVVSPVLEDALIKTSRRPVLTAFIGFAALSLVPSSTALAAPPASPAAKAPAANSAAASSLSLTEQVGDTRDKLAALKTALDRMDALTGTLKSNVPTKLDSDAALKVRTLTQAVKDVVGDDATIDAEVRSAEQDLTKTAQALSARLPSADSDDAKTPQLVQDARKLLRDDVFPVTNGYRNADGVPSKTSQYNRRRKAFAQALTQITTAFGTKAPLASDFENRTSALPTDPIIGSDDNADAVRGRLAAVLPTATATLAAYRALRPEYDALQKAWDAPKLQFLYDAIATNTGLKPNTQAISALPTAATLFSTPLNKLASFVNVLPDTLNKLTKAAESASRYAKDAQSAVLRGDEDPSPTTDAATARLGPWVQDGQMILKGLMDFSAELMDRKQSDAGQLFQAAPLKLFTQEHTVELIGAARRKFDVAVETGVSRLTTLAKTTSIDKRFYVADSVRLYYFDDVPRLMRAITGQATLAIGDKDRETARAAADTARADLEAATLDVAAKRSAVNEARVTLQNRLASLEARLKEAQTEEDAADSKTKAAKDGSDSRKTAVRKAEDDDDAAQKTVREKKAVETRAQEELDSAQARLAAKPEDPDLVRTRDQKQTAFEDARDARRKAERDAEDTANTLKRVQARQDSDVQDLTSARDEAGGRVTTLRKEIEDLRAKVDDAEAAATTAATALEQARIQAGLKALTNNTAFARARDNAPYYEFVPPAKPSDDPAQRVLFYGFPDTRTIFLRGAPEDVGRVKRLISLFDQPQAQAVISLFTLEMTNDGDRFGYNRLNTQLAEVRAQLTFTNQSSQEVLNAIPAALREETLHPKPQLTESDTTPFTNYDFAPMADKHRLQYAYEDVLRPLLGKTLRDGDPSDRSLPNFLRDALPDPANTTTLAESLIILSLLPRASREAVLSQAETSARTKLSAVAAREKSRRKNADAEATSKNQSQADDFSFDNLRIFLGPNGDGPQIIAFQREVVAFLTLRAFDNAVEELLALARERDIARKARQAPVVADSDIADVPSVHDAKEKLAEADKDVASARYKAALQTRLGEAQKRFAANDYKLQTSKTSKGFNPQIQALTRESRDSVQQLQAQLVIAQGSLTLPLANQKRTTAQKEYEDAVAKAKSDYGSIQGYRLEEPDITYQMRLVAQWISERLGISADSLGIPLKNVAPDGDPKVYVAYTKEDLQALTPKNTADITALPDKDRDNLRAALKAFRLSADDIASVIDRFRRRAGYDSQQNARVAALNEMLKKYVQAIDKDIDQGIVTPRMNKIRSDIFNARRSSSNKGLSLGILQHESILVSNRQIARVDPSASLALSLPDPDKQDEQDLNAAASQFGQILGGLGQGAARLAGGAASGLLGSSLGSLSSILPTATRGLTPPSGAGQIGSLPGGVRGNSTTSGTATGSDNSNSSKSDKEKQYADPGIYGITTGNVFQVTPIFDPTGQALRFHFDFVSQSLVREPNDTISPELPRIERHGVNTEVQLSNQDITIISEYASNARLGRASTTNGGLPVFKHIPVVKEIPFIGWFTRRPASAAQVAESIIFARTTMYPTIGDVVALLSRSAYTPITNTVSKPVMTADPAAPKKAP